MVSDTGGPQSQQPYLQRGAFPTDEAIHKVLYLGIQRIATNWTAPIPEWKRALNQFAMIVGDRVPTSD